MDEVLEALYKVAESGSGEEYWLFNEDFARSYAACAKYAEDARHKLEIQLCGTDAKLFRTYAENTEELERHRRHILFHRGLAMGVYLATLGR